MDVFSWIALIVLIALIVIFVYALIELAQTTRAIPASAAARKTFIVPSAFTRNISGFGAILG